MKRDIAYTEVLVSDADSNIRAILTSYDNVIELLKDALGLIPKALNTLLPRLDWI